MSRAATGVAVLSVTIHNRSAATIDSFEIYMCSWYHAPKTFLGFTTRCEVGASGPVSIGPGVRFTGMWTPLYGPDATPTDQIFSEIIVTPIRAHTTDGITWSASP
jgi:hypothetical protein